ncbi:MAG: GIY-YIG nuclease family protein [Patescibacteria group bacterium]
MSLLRRCGRVVARRLAMYYTYVLRSLKDLKFYIGSTNDLRKRLEKHLKGKVTATKDRRQLKLIYYEACLNKLKSFEREKYFKTGFGRRFLKSRI